jgi:hypothetical protein
MKLGLFEHFMKLIVKYCKLKLQSFFIVDWAVLYYGTLKVIIYDHKAVVKLHNISYQALIL